MTYNLTAQFLADADGGRHAVINGLPANGTALSFADLRNMILQLEKLLYAQEFLPEDSAELDQANIAPGTLPPFHGQSKGQRYRSPKILDALE